MSGSPTEGESSSSSSRSACSDEHGGIPVVGKKRRRRRRGSNVEGEASAKRAKGPVCAPFSGGSDAVVSSQELGGIVPDAFQRRATRTQGRHTRVLGVLANSRTPSSIGANTNDDLAREDPERFGSADAAMDFVLSHWNFWLNQVCDEDRARVARERRGDAGLGTASPVACLPRPPASGGSAAGGDGDSTGGGGGVPARDDETDNHVPFPDTEWEERRVVQLDVAAVSRLLRSAAKWERFCPMGAISCRTTALWLSLADTASARRYIGMCPAGVEFLPPAEAERVAADLAAGVVPRYSRPTPGMCYLCIVHLTNRVHYEEILRESTRPCVVKGRCFNAFSVTAGVYGGFAMDAVHDIPDGLRSGIFGYFPHDDASLYVAVTERLVDPRDKTNVVMVPGLRLVERALFAPSLPSSSYCISPGIQKPPPSSGPPSGGTSSGGGGGGGSVTRWTSGSGGSRSSFGANRGEARGGGGGGKRNAFATMPCLLPPVASTVVPALTTALPTMVELLDAAITRTPTNMCLADIKWAILPLSRLLSDHADPRIDTLASRAPITLAMLRRYLVVESRTQSARALWALYVQDKAQQDKPPRRMTTNQLAAADYLGDTGVARLAGACCVLEATVHSIRTTSAATKVNLRTLLRHRQEQLSEALASPDPGAGLEAAVRGDTPDAVALVGVELANVLVAHTSSLPRSHAPLDPDDIVADAVQVCAGALPGWAPECASLSFSAFALALASRTASALASLVVSVDWQERGGGSRPWVVSEELRPLLASGEWVASPRGGRASIACLALHLRVWLADALVRVVADEEEKSRFSSFAAGDEEEGSVVGRVLGWRRRRQADLRIAIARFRNACFGVAHLFSSSAKPPGAAPLLSGGVGVTDAELSARVPDAARIPGVGLLDSLCVYAGRTLHYGALPVLSPDLLLSVGIVPGVDRSRVGAVAATTTQKSRQPKTAPGQRGAQASAAGERGGEQEQGDHDENENVLTLSGVLRDAVEFCWRDAPVTPPSFFADWSRNPPAFSAASSSKEKKKKKKENEKEKEKEKEKEVALCAQAEDLAVLGLGLVLLGTHPFADTSASFARGLLVHTAFVAGHSGRRERVRAVVVRYPWVRRTCLGVVILVLLAHFPALASVVSRQAMERARAAAALLFELHEKKKEDEDDDACWRECDERLEALFSGPSGDVAAPAEPRAETSLPKAMRAALSAAVFARQRGLARKPTKDPCIPALQDFYGSDSYERLSGLVSCTRPGSFPSPDLIKAVVRTDDGASAAALVAEALEALRGGAKPSSVGRLISERTMGKSPQGDRVFALLDAFVILVHSHSLVTACRIAESDIVSRQRAALAWRFKRQLQTGATRNRSTGPSGSAAAGLMEMEDPKGLGVLDSPKTCERPASIAALTLPLPFSEEEEASSYDCEETGFPVAVLRVMESMLVSRCCQVIRTAVTTHDKPSKGSYHDETFGGSRVSIEAETGKIFCEGIALSKQRRERGSTMGTGDSCGTGASSSPASAPGRNLAEGSRILSMSRTDQTSLSCRSTQALSLPTLGYVITLEGYRQKRQQPRDRLSVMVTPCCGHVVDVHCLAMLPNKRVICGRCQPSKMELTLLQAHTRSVVCSGCLKDGSNGRSRPILVLEDLCDWEVRARNLCFACFALLARTSVQKVAETRWSYFTHVFAASYLAVVFRPTGKKYAPARLVIERSRAAAAAAAASTPGWHSTYYRNLTLSSSSSSPVLSRSTPRPSQ